MNRTTQGRIAPEVADAAADWFSRLQEEDSSEQDFQEWQRWLGAAPEHGQAYREIERAWRLIGDVDPLPWSSQSELNAASSPLPACGETTAWMQELDQRKEPLRRVRVRGLSKSLTYALAASVAVFATLAVSAYLMTRHDTYSTRIAEQRSVRLPDGSRVTLGAASKVTPTFGRAARRIELNFGEAFFEVSHDPARPFTVIAGASEIRAIGTAFNVRATSDRVWVNVTEGRVAVVPAKDSARREVLLAAGERTSITRAGILEERAQATNAATWLQGRFEYRGEELRNVIDDLNRYTDRRIVLTDESLGRLRYSGTVFPDHLDEWLQGIDGALPVVVRDTGERREISSARK